MHVAAILQTRGAMSAGRIRQVVRRGRLEWSNILPPPRSNGRLFGTERRSAGRRSACRPCAARSGREFCRASSILCSPRTKTADATPASTPRTTYNSKVNAPELRSFGSASSLGTEKAGAGPKTSRPTKVAMPVAVATGRNVLTLTSGNISSVTKSTPPMGVLKVAAMPAPAPAATRVIRWPASS